MIGMGIEDEDKKHTWLEDAESVSICFDQTDNSYSILLPA